MVTSHLERLGCKVVSASTVDVIGKQPARNEFIVLDYNFLTKPCNGEKISSSIACDRVIVLTPLIATANLKLPSSWKSVTKPVTLSSLYESVSPFLKDLEAESESQKGSDAEPNSKKLKILVAEDVETNQKIAKEMLQLLNFDIDIAENGAIALEKFKSGSYALIFMDCQMPVMDGFETTKEIRCLEKSLGKKPIPIIALTAGIGKEDRDRCDECGMDDYLTKPFSISELSESIRQFESRIKGLESQRVRNNGQPDQNIKTSEINLDPYNREIFNFKAINNIREVEKQTGKPILGNILAGFTSQMEDKLVEISRDLKDGNPERLSRTAHAIKSMSANIGAEKVRSISAQVEEWGKAGKFEEVPNSLSDLSQAYQEFVEKFKSSFMT